MVAMPRRVGRAAVYELGASTCGPARILPSFRPLVAEVIRIAYAYPTTPSRAQEE
jgi:hypothetical protein